MVVCTLTLLDDTTAVYEDSLLHKREQRKHVTGPLGGNALTRETARLLSRWVGTYGDSCRRSELQILGQHLYEIAFGGRSADGSGEPPLGQAFQQAYSVFRDRPSETEQLRLRLVIGTGVRELGNLPWEFLYMPWNATGFFLAGQRTRLVLTRYVPNSDRPPEDEGEDSDAKLRILLVTSRPTAPGLGIVNADEIVDQVVKLQSDQIQVTDLDSPSRRQLRERIGHWKPHIVHLIGHGRPGAIALRAEDDELERRARVRANQRDLGQAVDLVDEADWVDSVSVCTLLRQGLDEVGGPGRLVFLHACNGASSLKAFNSVAVALADSERIAAVVAMRFASVFYSHLAQQLPVDEAVTLARRELGEEPNPGHQAWDHRNFGTPVVYLRSSDPLFRRMRNAFPPPPEARQAEQAPSALPAKALCPNPYCEPNVSVFRAKGRCDICRQQFVACPRAGCAGLVVTAAGFVCSVCDYRFEGAVAESGHGPTQPADPRPAGGPSIARPAPPSRPGSIR
jgi:hypothetical protein